MKLKQYMLYLLNKMNNLIKDRTSGAMENSVRISV